MKRLTIFLNLLFILCLLGCTASTPESSEDIIDTEYFTLPLPPGVCYSIIPEDDRFSIEFYEQQDYETNGIGKLCTLNLYKEGEDFTVPGHMLYGVLVTKRVDYELVALYPTEVTYTPANANQHKALQETINNILIYDLQPKDGVKWLRPQLEGSPISEIVIETQHYTVKLPEKWVGKCVDYIEEFEDGTSIVTFYEKESYEDFGGGKLCAIHLVTEDVEWSSVPDASLFGSLETPDGRFTIVGSFPKDKQFNKDTMERYNDLSSLTSDLFSTITPKDGCTLHRPGFSTDRPADYFQ